MSSSSKEEKEERRKMVKCDWRKYKTEKKTILCVVLCVIG